MMMLMMVFSMAVGFEVTYFYIPFSCHFAFSQSVLLLTSCVIQQTATIFTVEDVRRIQASCVW